MPTTTGTVGLATRTVQVFTSGSGTYTTPAGCKAIWVRCVGGGGGGGGTGTSPAAATAGGNTTFGTALLTANGGGLGGVTANAQSVVEGTKVTDNWSVEVNAGAITPLTHSAFFKSMRPAFGV